MKVIFSRKGVDSTAGGCASPLIDGTPLSLPIPTLELTAITYGDLRSDLAESADHLSAGRLDGAQPCHLDPDLDPSALAQRPPGWRGALGQAGAALGHLDNQGVGAGDLFLFWGLYRPAERAEGGWRYTGRRCHALFGWLHVGDVCRIDDDGTAALARHPWLCDHPHVRPGWSLRNAVYAASGGFTLAGQSFAGSGLFKRAAILTAPESRLPSLWQVPCWLDPSADGTGLTYHPPERWLGQGRLKSAARGQEFVADIRGRDDAASWIADLLTDYS